MNEEWIYYNRIDLGTINSIRALYKDNKAKINQLNSYLKDKKLELVDKTKLLATKQEILERYEQEEVPF